MPGLAHLGYLAAVPEVTWGTNPAAGYTAQPIQGESLEHKPNYLFEKPIVGTRNAPTQKVKGGERAAGTVNFDADVEGILGLLLAGACSDETLTDYGSGNGALHVFVPKDEVPPSMSLLVSRDTTVDADNVWEYLGAKVGKLSFTAAEGQLLKCVASVTAKLGQQGATGITPTYSTEQPLVYHTGTFKIGGSSVAVKSFKVDVDLGLYADRGELGTPYIQEQQPGLVNVTGEIEAYFDSLDLVNDFLDGTDASIELVLTGTAVGTKTRSLSILVPVAQFTGTPPSLPNSATEIMLKLPFQAWLSGAGSPDALVQFSLLNSKRTTYY